ncbi:MAG: hypothetical protein WC796_02880 [Candidatus Pacearchaeota archaeon]|jgi:hypothetical protein
MNSSIEGIDAYGSFGSGMGFGEQFDDPEVQENLEEMKISESERPTILFIVYSPSVIPSNGQTHYGAMVSGFVRAGPGARRRL